MAIFQAVLVTWVSFSLGVSFEQQLIKQVVGVMLNIALGFCAGNVLDTLASPLGNPAAQVFFNAAGKKTGLALWFWPILIQFFTGKFLVGQPTLLPVEHY